MQPRRPRLTPAIADVRRAVRESLALAFPAVPEPVEGASPGNSASTSSATGGPLVLVALSGGPDSLALAAAVAFEAPRAGLRAGAIIIDHALQQSSEDVAARAAEQASALGLDPVVVRRVEVGVAGGPEAAAREARYAAFSAVVAEFGASAVLVGHTLDDQAETVLLGLARGAGARSLSGMAPVAFLPAVPELVEGPPLDRRPSTGSGTVLLRPLLEIRRATTVQACADAALEPWADPHNDDPAYSRVRVRTQVLPMLERELGPGIADALARTAAQLRDDADALDHFAEEQIEELAEHAEAGLSLPVAALAANPPALRQRLIRLAVSAEFGVSLGQSHTLAVARLVSDWHGQGALDLPGVRVERRGGTIYFTAASA